MVKMNSLIFELDFSTKFSTKVFKKPYFSTYSFASHSYYSGSCFVPAFTFRALFPNTFTLPANFVHCIVRRWVFQSFYADVFNQRSLAEPWTPVALPPHSVSFSSMYRATQTTDCYWSEESFLSLIGFHQMDRTPGQPQAKLSLLRSISLKIDHCTHLLPVRTCKVYGKLHICFQCAPLRGLWMLHASS